MTKMGVPLISYVFDDLAPVLGFALLLSIIHVFDELAPTFGLSCLPSQAHVLEYDAPTLGFISFPEKIHVFDEVAPVFGFSVVPSQTQFFGSSILLAISFPLRVQVIDCANIVRFVLRIAIWNEAVNKWYLYH